jgi:endonuclease III
MGPQNPKPFQNRTRNIWLSEVAVIMVNVIMAAREKDISWEDANKTLYQWFDKIDRQVDLNEDDIESGLWACNLLDEKNKFIHYIPGKTFKRFLRDLLSKGELYDRLRNYFTFKRKREKNV